VSTEAERDPAEDWTEAGPIHDAGEVRYQREMLGHRVDAFLRGAGWHHTSSTPGCVWLWEREIDGRRILVNEATALHMQQELED
jgi:hypothetical protein